ncbi:MAG: ABC transporter ATP-binding protein [Acidobacteria bacterium]|nr:ABC transporter ATP-binding protein [Acidobacteriota bacterium]
MNIFRVEDISASYNGKPVLKDISFRINKGEFVSIVGPNGAGKSTILKILASILDAGKGSAYYKDELIQEYSARELAKEISYLPQSFQPAFPLTCFDMVMTGRTPYLKGLMLGSRKDRDIVYNAMRETDCFEFINRDFNSISVGEQQRVIFARALASEPEVLLLDEPTASLDLRHAVTIYRMLDRLREEKGLTVITVSHNLNITSRFSRRIILMDSGKIICDGKTGDVINEKYLKVLYGDTFRVIYSEQIKGNIIVPVNKVEE